jgi:integrase
LLQAGQGHSLDRRTGQDAVGGHLMPFRLKRVKGSKAWYIRGTVAGVELRESTGTADKHLAEQYRLKREREVYQEAALGNVQPATFADAVAAYVNAGKPGRFLTQLLDHFTETPLPKIGQAEIDAAANAIYPKAKASTLNRQVYGPMIAVLRYAKRCELPGSAVPMVEMRKVQKPAVTPADDEHIAKLLPHCSEGLRALIILMTYTGLRTGEALRVRQEDVNGGYVFIGKTKNGQPRMVPAPDGWEYPHQGFGFGTSQGVGRAIRRASKLAGIEHKDGHELGRHAFAARWLAAGGSLKALQEAGGWEKLGTVADHYSHLERSSVHDFMRKLSEKK